MPKPNKPLLLSLSLCFLLLVFLPVLLFAQNETLTITTYYPSPYGTYNQLGTNKLAVGYTGSSDQPSITGDMRLYPQSGSPTSWSAGKQGEVVYASTDGYLYAYNGSSWIKQGGGGGALQAWVNFDGPTGNIRASSGIASVTRVSAGKYTVTLSSAMADTNYAVVAMSQIDNASIYIPTAEAPSPSGFVRTTTQFQIYVYAYFWSYTGDPTSVSVVVYR